ncbi:unnamed protein product [Coregonus sp. 'balchen']|nr:unnamed protein product [Coregonus sp. 'balchen']
MSTSSSAMAFICDSQKGHKRGEREAEVYGCPPWIRVVAMGFVLNRRRFFLPQGGAVEINVIVVDLFVCKNSNPAK